jgi:glycosyltransferase involved in cell wall biosynthesis
MTKVSIIIPTYNRAAYLKACIESILSQDYDNFEIIISDNASTDNTTEIVKAFNDPKIIYHRNETNIGVVGNHNKALELSTGEYIHIFSDDDLMLADCIKKKAEILNAHPSVGLVHSDINIIDEEGKIKSNDHWAKSAWKKWFEIHSESKLFSNKEYHIYLYRIRNFISMPSVMIRKSVIDKVGYMDTSLKYIIDWDYWLKITLFFDVYYVDQKLISYRLYSTNFYNTITSKTYMQEEKIMRNHINERFPNNIIVNNNFLHDILQHGGYYTHYSIINPINYLIKKSLPFIPFEKISKRKLS